MKPRISSLMRPIRSTKKIATMTQFSDQGRRRGQRQMGERHFIKAVLEASSLVDDPELEAAIKPFIQQESWHAWAHQVVVDLDTCDGNGVCMSICHQVFDLREDGLHLLQHQPDSELRQQLIGAAVSCPTQAITVKD